MEAGELELFDRGIRRATESCSGEALDAALAELGWHDALSEDRHTAVALLFEAQGATNTTSAALDHLLAAALLGDRADEGQPAVVLPPLRRDGAPGQLLGEGCEVRGLGTAALARGDSTIVCVTDGDRHVALAVKATELECSPAPGLDPALGLVEVSGAVAMAEVAQLGPADWTGAVTVGQLALGHELVGVARAMLELARQHALDRVQFGRPIASFQAVRHRLAESLVAVEAAASLLDAAWDDPSPVTAAMAKSLAGRSARTAARHAQQVLAGIGFTTEHPFHTFFRRAILLDQLLGSSSVLTRRLGSEVLLRGTLPPAFPL